MPAKHKAEDEIRVCLFTHTPEPTHEYYGICSVCFGDGKAPTFEKHIPYEDCWNCGGDGKSEREE